MRHLWKRPATLLLGLAVVGCASMRPPGLVPTTSPRTVTLSLRPSPAGERQAQAVVSPYSASNIQRLDIVPYVEAGTNVYQPLSAVTGSPTDESDPQLLKLSQSAPAINLNRSFTFSNLKPNHRYRFYARAYAVDGGLLSADAYSYSELTLTNNDRPALAATLPLQLIDRSFAGATSVTVSNTGGIGYEQVVASLVKVVNGSETPVTSQTISRTSIPKTLLLTNLKANSTYRLKISARKADSTEVATTLATVAVGTDDRPTTQAVSFSAPSIYRVTTYANNGFGTLGDPNGIARDSNGLLYVVNNLAGTVWKFYDANVQQQIASNLSGPSGIAVDSAGNVYVSETGTGTIKKITPGGAQSTYASGFTMPYDLAIDSTGTLYVADGYANCVKKVMPGGGVSPLATLAGSAEGVAVDSSGNVYAAIPTGIVKIAPGGSASPFATVTNPIGLTVDASGNVFATAGHGIWRITPAGAATLVAGSTTQANLVNADGLSARFSGPIGIVLLGGVLYVADTGNKALRQIVP